MLETDGSMIRSSRSDGNDYWYRQDIRGSVTNIVDEDDDVVKSYTYDAYGNTESTGTFVNSFAYTGAVIDTETGLYYMNARYYDPGTGRFISQDTYRGEGEVFWNLYMYCDGDPVNCTDPTGGKMTHIKPNPPKLIPMQWYHMNIYDVNTSKKFIKASKTALAAAVTAFLKSKGVIGPAGIAAVVAAAYGTYYFVNSDEENIYFFIRYYYRITGKGKYDSNGNYMGNYQIKKWVRTTKDKHNKGGQVRTIIKKSTIITPWF